MSRRAQRSPAGAAARAPAPTLAQRAATTGKRSTGQPLDPATRSVMEGSFARDFSSVRVHTDAEAAASAQAVNARAYTIGRDVVFGAGQYAPVTASGRRLLGHELAHVIQQSETTPPTDGALSIGPDDSPLEHEADRAGAAAEGGARAHASPRQAGCAAQLQRDGFGDVRRAEARDELRARLKLDYKKAERHNKAFAKSGPAWEAKLATAAGGAYKTWHDLWTAADYNAFADKVASYQIDLDLPEKDIDGVLGPGTWARLAGLGEAMAGIQKVTWPESEYTCTTASVERIKRGARLATGKAFELPEDKTLSEFNLIAQSYVSRMADVALEYRGSGPAGALVYAGLGTFVPESDIWAGKLEPGAVLQVWGSRKDYDLLRAGEIGEGKKKRLIRDSDASFYGTSFVFVRYDTKTHERMLVRHYGSTEWKSKSSYDVWVAANAIQP